MQLSLNIPLYLKGKAQSASGSLEDPVVLQVGDEGSSRPFPNPKRTMIKTPNLNSIVPFTDAKHLLMWWAVLRP